MYKRLISTLLIFALLIGIGPINVSAAASNDYTQWKQYDAEWNNSEAWPKSQYPGATLYYMRDAGCLVTSIAMLLRQYNVVTEADVNQFNPWIVNNTLASNGVLDSAADVKWYDIQTAYPGFVYQGYCGYSLSELKNLYNAGYACIVQVMGSGGYYHFVAVRSIDGDNVIIMDPGSESTSLSTYGSVYTIHYFSATPSNVPYIEKCNSYPSHCTIQVTKEAYVMSQPCSSGTDSSSTHIETIQKGSTLTAIGLYLNTQGNLWYKIITPNGAEAFIPSSHTAFKNQVNTDISLAGKNEPENIDLGSVYSIAGEIKADRNELTSVFAHVYRGAEPNWEWMTGGSDAPSNNYYTLNRSNIDNRVLFNELPTGVYTYIIGADYKGYYAINEKTLGTYSGSARLHENMFSVGGASLVKTYTIHYDANGGFDTPEDQQKVYGEDLILTIAEPKKLGYSFQGWSTNATASSATYTLGSVYTVNAGTTLYAVWKSEPSYTVTYHANGGLGGPQNLELPYGHPASFSTIAPKKEGYNFIGWSTDPNATVVEFFPGYGYDKYESITLYATWEKLEGDVGEKDAEPNETIATEPEATEAEQAGTLPFQETKAIDSDLSKDICVVIIKDGLTTEQHFSAICFNDEIYMQPEAFADITRYQYKTIDSRYIYQLGLKSVVVDYQNNTLLVNNTKQYFSGVYTENGHNYLPMSELLPWLNISCKAANGKLYIESDLKSYWEAAEHFNYADYEFNLADEYGGGVGDLIGLSSIAVFDCILDLENIWKKMIVTDRSNTRLYDYEIYKDCFREFALPNDFLGYAEDGIGVLSQYVSDGTGIVTDLLGDLADMSILKTSSAGLQALNTGYIYLRVAATDTGKYAEALEYIYLRENASHDSGVQKAAKEVIRLLESAAYATDSGLQNAYLEFGEIMAEDAIADNIDELLTDSVLGTLGTYIDICDFALSQIWPVNEAYSEISRMTTYQAIQHDALTAYHQAHKVLSEMNSKDIQNARMSAIIFLKTARKCYEALDMRNSVYGAEGLYDTKIKIIEDKLFEFELCALFETHDAICDKTSEMYLLKEIWREI